MRTHPRQALAPLLLALTLLLSACAGQATPQPTAVPTAGAAVPTAGTAAVPTSAPAPTSAPTPAAVTETAAQALPLPAWARTPYASGTRSADGKPSAKYWQNTSQHTMRISVMPPSRTITGSQEITYFNRSPYPLQVLYLRTYLDVHQPEAARDEPVLDSFYSDGVQVDEFKVNGEVKPWPGTIAPTLVQLKLDQPLQPNSSITFSISWRYELTDANSLAGGRTWKEGAVDTTTFYLAYFYPRMAVLNDSGEWNTTPFTLGSEFSDDFNDYTFEVTVPRNYVVWATGDLQNPDEVLQPTYAQRLKDAQTSDATVSVATPAELQGGQVTAQSDTVTWKWKADNVRDIAIGLSDRYNWDAGSVVVDPATGRRAEVHGAYPDTAPLYKTIVEDGKGALVFGSTKFPGVPYPYSRTSIFVGGADEEYPMMVNDSAEAPPGMTVGLVAGHEILHSWFPFYMGTDERRYPFMDEGWTTAFDYLLAIDVLGQEGADAYFQNFRGGVNLPADSYIPIILPQEKVRVGTTAFANNQYGKAALAYLALKDLLGDEQFKAGLYEFIARWNGKHPLPWDMFASFNAGSGENLNWFFDKWFFSYDSIDLGLGDVAKVDGGYAVTVKNSGGLPIPFDVVVSYTDATTETLHQTPALWREDVWWTQCQAQPRDEFSVGAPPVALSNRLTLR